MVFNRGGDAMGAKVLPTAVEFGLFTKLAKQRLTGEELGLHLRATFDFLDALVATRFLGRDADGPGAKYFNTTEGSMFLDQVSPRYIGGVLVMLNARLFRLGTACPRPCARVSRRTRSSTDRKGWPTRWLAGRDGDWWSGTAAVSVLTPGAGWRILQPWSAASQATWTAVLAGSYMTQVWVRSAASTAAYETWRGMGVIAVANGLLTVARLDAAGQFPASVGGTVTWTPTIAGGDGAALEYL